MSYLNLKNCLEKPLSRKFWQGHTSSCGWLTICRLVRDHCFWHDCLMVDFHMCEPWHQISEDMSSNICSLFRGKGHQVNTYLKLILMPQPRKDQSIMRNDKVCTHSGPPKKCDSLVSFRRKSRGNVEKNGQRLSQFKRKKNGYVFAALYIVLKETVCYLIILCPAK